MAGPSSCRMPYHRCVLHHQHKHNTNNNMCGIFITQSRVHHNTSATATIGPNMTKTTWFGNGRNESAESFRTVSTKNPCGIKQHKYLVLSKRTWNAKQRRENSCLYVTISTPIVFFRRQAALLVSYVLGPPKKSWL